MTTAPSAPAVASEPEALASWDLRAYYAGHDDPRLTADLETALEAARTFEQRFKGRVASLDAQAMREALESLDQLNTLLWKAAGFARLINSADSRPPEHGRLVSRASEVSAQIDQHTLFFDLEFNAISDEAYAALVASPMLAQPHYAHLLRRKRAYKPHLLSEDVEKVLSLTDLTRSQAWNRMFHEIVDYTRYKVEGEDVERSLEEIISRLYSPDRTVRRLAADAITRGLARHERTLTHLFNTLLLDKKIDDEMRHYEGPAHARHLANQTDQASVDAMLEACERYHPMVERYYHLKARFLGIDQLEDYDRYAPMGEVDRTFTYAEACDLVMTSFRAFSPTIAALAQRFFDGNWIDVPPREGKRHGAFCSGGVPGVHSVVLLNFTGRASDVKTLAHELGHGIQFELTRERQPVSLMYPPLTLAETASVFAERIVFDRLVRTTPDPRDRLALLCQELESSFATVFRQVGFTRFEMLAHTARRQEGELSFSRLCDLWMESGQPMFGKAVRLRPEYRLWWMYIPHFIHTPFYCYAYAYGKLLTLALYQMYQERGEPFIADYIELLAAGGADDPAVLLRPFGIDTRDAGFWTRGLDALDAMVREAEALVESLKP